MIQARIQYRVRDPSGRSNVELRDVKTFYIDTTEADALVALCAQRGWFCELYTCAPTSLTLIEKLISVSELKREDRP
jgi:hypothetical protein